MKTEKFEITTTPSDQPDSYEVFQAWVIDDDITTPDVAFENTPQPWFHEYDENREYVFFIHAKFSNAEKVKVTVGDISHEWVLAADKILKRMMHI